jgi:hypothetical protein
MDEAEQRLIAFRKSNVITSRKVLATLTPRRKHAIVFASFGFSADWHVTGREVAGDLDEGC